MNPQEQRQQLQALKESIQSMSAWIQIKQSVLDAYAWKIDDLRSQLRKRNWNRGSAPTLKQELHQVQLRYSNLEESLHVEQALLAEQQRILDEYKQIKPSQSFSVKLVSFAEQRSTDVRDRPLPFSEGSRSASVTTTVILDSPIDEQRPPVHDLFVETDSEIFFRELTTELQTLTHTGSEFEPNVDLGFDSTSERSADMPLDLPDELLQLRELIAEDFDFEPELSGDPPLTINSPSEALVSPLTELYPEENQSDWFSDPLQRPDATLAQLGSFSMPLEEISEDIPALFVPKNSGLEVQENPVAAWPVSAEPGSLQAWVNLDPAPSQPSPASLASTPQRQTSPLQATHVYETQQQIQRLEATIQKMSAWIDQQQDELAAYAWTIQDLRDRLKVDRLNLRSSISIRQELDYVLQQHSSLEQSIQLQRQKQTDSQRQLDNYYEQLARIQTEYSLEEAIAQTTAWIQQQQDELDTCNWTIQDLRHRLSRDMGNPRTTIGVQQELDYALEQYSSLEHSLYRQKQKLAEQHQQLHVYRTQATSSDR